MADQNDGGCRRACCDGSQACYLGDHAHDLWSRLSYHDNPYRLVGACRVNGPRIGRATCGGPGGSFDSHRRLGDLPTGLCDGSRGLGPGPYGLDTDAAPGQNGPPLGSCHCALHRLGSATARDIRDHRRGDPCYVDRHPSGGVFLVTVSGCLQDEPWFFCDGVRALSLRSSRGSSARSV